MYCMVCFYNRVYVAMKKILSVCLWLSLVITYIKIGITLIGDASEALTKFSFFMSIINGVGCIFAAYLILEFMFLVFDWSDETGKKVVSRALTFKEKILSEGKTLLPVSVPSDNRVNYGKM